MTKNAKPNANDVKVERFDFCFGSIGYFDENCWQRTKQFYM